MTRIFLSLAILGNAALAAAFWLGWRIEDAASADPAALGRVTLHFLTGLGALCFTVFVHALVLTYFMGTGRWLEETCHAYRLAADWQQRSKELKWRMYPAMILSLLVLISAGAYGGAADPASAIAFQGYGPLTAAQVHLAVAAAAIGVNAAVNILEFMALTRNGALVVDVLAEVRRIRTERGLDI